MTPEDLLEPLPSGTAALAERLREVIRQTLPEAEERAYPVWRGIGYRHPQAGYVCGIFPFPDRVALAFENGVLLADPKGLLKPGRTSAKKVLYLEVRRVADIKVRPLQALIREAAAVGLRKARMRRSRRTRRS